MSDLESTGVLLIAHLLCEYLIVAKLRVVNLYLKAVHLAKQFQRRRFLEINQPETRIAYGSHAC